MKPNFPKRLPPYATKVAIEASLALNSYLEDRGKDQNKKKSRKAWVKNVVGMLSIKKGG